MKKVIIVLASVGFVISSLGFVLAQNAQSRAAKTQTQSETQAARQTQSSRDFGLGSGHGFGRGFGPGHEPGGGFGGLPFGHHLALGTTVTLSFYVADPTNGDSSTPEQTLNFVYGEDSEAAFAQSFAEARANAGYVTLNVGEQTQTLELPADPLDLLQK